MTAEAIESPQEASPERERATFEFDCDGPIWRGVPVVNGHRILTTTDIDVHIDAKSIPVVTLRLVAADMLKLALGGAAVQFDDETREALLSLGWTAPVEPEPIPGKFALHPNGSTLLAVTCTECGATVPVTDGDVEGIEPADLAATCADMAVRQCPEHEPIPVAAR